MREEYLTNKLCFFESTSIKSVTMKASRYVDIVSVGSNVVTLTGRPSMTKSF